MTNGIEYMDLGTDDPAVIGAKVTGKISGDDMAGLIDRLEKLEKSGQKARLYLNLADYEGYDFSVVKEKFEHMSTLWNSIERCAYVVDKGWMTTAIGLIDAVTPMHLRAFGTDQDAEARAWVKESA